MNNKSVAFGVHIPVMGFAKPRTFEKDLVISFAQEAESLGYDSLSINDHVVFRKSWLDPLSTLAAVAATTSAIKLGTSILNIVVRNPIICAQAIATIDNLSSGRLFAGVGPGSYRGDFDICGIPFEERWGRFTEAVQILRLVLSQPSRVNYRGKYYQYGDPSFQLVEPSQKPHPPILIGSWGSDLGLRRCAKYGDGWMASAYHITPEKFKAKWHEVSSHRTSLGKDIESFDNSLVSMFGYISDDKERVDRVLKDVLAPALARSADELKESLLFGPLNECFQKVRSYVEAGAMRIHFWPLDDYFEQIRLFRKGIADSSF
jgi:alkanesulfonate monooxygenase SsuD/methylene tetrahydromethanopterin reductase-like flavin-dependent oxidoreductase (luciferase family)